MLVGEIGAHRVQARVHERLDERVGTRRPARLGGHRAEITPCGQPAEPAACGEGASTDGGARRDHRLPRRPARHRRRSPTTARTASRCRAPTEVTRVVTGVSAQRELFERAAAAGAQLVLCHHGMFWDFQPRSIEPAMKARLRAPVRRRHLPRRLPPAARRPSRGRQQRADLRGARARAGRAASPSTRARRRLRRALRRAASRSPSCVERCTAAFGQEPFVFDAGPETVHSVGDPLRRRPGSLARRDRARRSTRS